MHGFVPDVAALLHAIQPVLKFPDIVLLPRLFKSLRLLHVDDFVSRKEAIEVSSLDVYLLYFPIVDSGDV